jgi:hypothetical protein
VWMQTFDSEHNAVPEHRPFARVAKDGQLVPEVVQVIEIIARHLLSTARPAWGIPDLNFIG